MCFLDIMLYRDLVDLLHVSKIGGYLIECIRRLKYAFFINKPRESDFIPYAINLVFDTLEKFKGSNKGSPIFP